MRRWLAAVECLREAPAQLDRGGCARLRHHRHQGALREGGVECRKYGV